MEFNWRTQRQIIIFTIYILIILIPVFAISYMLLKKTPSCYDGIQNASEEGIDCNGTCQLRCDGTYRDLKVNFSRAMKVSDGVYDIFALVENYNLNINFPNVPYSLTFYSIDGAVLGNATGSFALLPQSKAAIYLPSLRLNQEPKTVDLSLQPHKALSFYDFSNVLKNVSVKNWQAQRGANNSLQVVGEIDNPNTREATNMSVYALLYDDTKTVYAVSKTKVYSIAGRQKSAVTFTWGDLITPSNVDFVVVFD